MSKSAVYNIDVAVIGGGPAGLAAATEAYNNGSSVMILERDNMLGGILNQCIHSGFGLHYFKEELTGPEYAARFSKNIRSVIVDEMRQAVENNVQRRLFSELNTMVLSVSNDKKIIAVSAAEGIMEINAKAIVFAMGCRERNRGALNIPGTRPAGIFTAGCAQRLCNLDGKMIGKKVVILGSGDIGLIMARRLTYEGARVECVAEIMPYSSGLSRNIVQCLDDNNIPLYYNTTVTRIEGTERVTAVTIARVDDNRKPVAGTERRIECDALLLSVGLIPENELTSGAGIALDRVTNGARVNQYRETNISGIFACGNVLHVHDLVDNVTKESIIAGKNASMYAAGKYAPGSGYNTKGEGAVRYVLPQVVNECADDEITLYFRVSTTVRKPAGTIKCNGEIIKTFRKAIMLPGEMETVKIKGSDIKGDITVAVGEGA